MTANDSGSADSQSQASGESLPTPASSSFSSSIPLCDHHLTHTSKTTTTTLTRNPLAFRHMSSIHALPVELLARIFYLGMIDPLPDPDASSAAPIPRDPPFEVLVSHVCTHWRAVALRTPMLWTNITVSAVAHIPRARVYVARSTRHPLRLLVDSASEKDHVPGHSIFRDEFLAVFVPLTPHIARWAALVLRVRDLACKRHARTVLSTCGPAPILDTLELWHIEDFESPERLYTAIGPPPVVVFSGRLPRLTRLSLIGVNIQWAEKASPFLRELTELELGVHSDDVRIPFDRWRAMLLASPGLARLSLHYSGPRAGAGPWTLHKEGRVQLRELRELRLVDLDAPYVCALLRTMDAPGVARLHVELGLVDAQDFTPLVDMLACAPMDDDDVIEPAVAYVSRTQKEKEDEDEEEDGQPMFPVLEELSVGALSECSSVSWRRFLQRLQSIRTLDANFGGMCPGAFDMLLQPADPRPSSSDPKGKQMETLSAILLPNLDTLRVSGTPGAALSAFATFRRQARRPIRRWYVNENCRDVHSERMQAEIDTFALSSTREEREKMEWFRDEDEEDEEGEEEGDAGLVVDEGEDVWEDAVEAPDSSEDQGSSDADGDQ